MPPEKNTEVGPAPVPFEVSPEVAFRNALSSPMVPKIYANGFSVVVQSNDLALLLGLAGAPTGIVSLPYSVAKALARQLSDAITGYESSTTANVLDAEFLDKKLKEGNVK